jgi:hypothetical protein
MEIHNVSVSEIFPFQKYSHCPSLVNVINVIFRMFLKIQCYIFLIKFLDIIMIEYGCI